MRRTIQVASVAFISGITAICEACPVVGSGLSVSCATACAVDATPFSSTAPGADGGGSIIDVAIQNFSFEPPSIVIHPGDTVRWTNLDAIEHTSTHFDLMPIWDSGLLSLGDTFERTFNSLGVFDYYCVPHGSSMLGSVTVKPRSTRDNDFPPGLIPITVTTVVLPEPSAIGVVIWLGAGLCARYRR